VRTNKGGNGVSDHDDEWGAGGDSEPAMPPPGPPPGVPVDDVASMPPPGAPAPSPEPAPHPGRGSTPVQKQRPRRRWTVGRIVAAVVLSLLIANRISNWVTDRNNDDYEYDDYEYDYTEDGGRSVCVDAIGDTSVESNPADPPADHRWFDLTSIEVSTLDDRLTVSFAFASVPPMDMLDAVGVHAWLQLTLPDNDSAQAPLVLTQHGSRVDLAAPDGQALSEPDFGTASQYGREIVWYLSFSGLQDRSGLGVDFDWNGGAVARFGGTGDPGAAAQQQPSRFVGTDHCGSGASASIPGTGYRHSEFDDAAPEVTTAGTGGSDTTEPDGGYVAPIEQALPWLAELPAWPAESIPMEGPGAMALTARCAAHVGIVAYDIVSATVMDRPVEAELDRVWPPAGRQAEWLAKARALAPRAIAEYRKHGRFIPEARTVLIDGALHDCGVVTS